MALRDWIPRIADGTAGRVTALTADIRRRAQERIVRFGGRERVFGAGERPEEYRHRSDDVPEPDRIAPSETGPAPVVLSTATDSVPAEPRTRLVPRRMGDPEYRRTQHAQIYEPHIAPINRLVDELRDESGLWMPYVAPIYGGTSARLLALFRDPGPKTQQDTGSGMLSLENDDPSAERHLGLVVESGLAASDLIPWNAYPWYINRKPTTAEIEQGLDSLQRLISLLPDLQVVIAHGKDAQTAWRRFVRSGRLSGRNFEVVTTYHTSRQAFWTPDPEERARRLQKLTDDYASVAAMLEADGNRPDSRADDLAR